MGRARIVNQIASDPNCHCQQPKVYDVLSFILGILAVIAATSNIVGGFLITDRMLKMFKSSRPAKS